MKYRALHERIVLLCAEAITYSQVESGLGISSPNRQLRRYKRRSAAAPQTSNGPCPSG
jgi:hypothetical protein